MDEFDRAVERAAERLYGLVPADMKHKKVDGRGYYTAWWQLDESAHERRLAVRRAEKVLRASGGVFLSEEQKRVLIVASYFGQPVSPPQELVEARAALDQSLEKPEVRAAVREEIRSTAREVSRP